VHRAVLIGGGAECYFVNVYNASPRRPVTVTHVWFEVSPPQDVLTTPLPAKIGPGEHWETYTQVSKLGAAVFDVERLARVKLADGTILESEPRTDVPAVGWLPG
jgi:hypothetical protein